MWFSLMIIFLSSLGSDFCCFFEFCNILPLLSLTKHQLIISVVIDWLLSLVEQELLTLPDHMSSHPVLSGVRVTRSLVWCVCFVDRCLSFCPFSFGHCIVFPTIYGFWLPLWYLQTLLKCQLSSMLYILMTREILIYYA